MLKIIPCVAFLIVFCIANAASSQVVDDTDDLRQSRNCEISCQKVNELSAKAGEYLHKQVEEN